VVVLKVKDGVRPPRPVDTLGLGLDDNLWSLIEKCWLADPSHRPPMSDVVEQLASGTYGALSPELHCLTTLISRKATVPDLILPVNQMASDASAEIDVEAIGTVYGTRVVVVAQPEVIRDIDGVPVIGAVNSGQALAP
jgi:hypothetical protein